MDDPRGHRRCSGSLSVILQNFSNMLSRVAKKFFSNPSRVAKKIFSPSCKKNFFSFLELQKKFFSILPFSSCKKIFSFKNFFSRVAKKNQILRGAKKNFKSFFRVKKNLLETVTPSGCNGRLLESCATRTCNRYHRWVHRPRRASNHRFRACTRRCYRRLRNALVQTAARGLPLAKRTLCVSLCL